jgi:hypothetical protein
VGHLVMLGAPNAGSPGPTLQDWATAALGIGLNSLSVVAWPARVLGGLVSAIETVDVTLDQLKPNSEFFRSLDSSPDPGVPYTVIAGNTSIIKPALEAAPDEESLLGRLLGRLGLEKKLHGISSLAFFGQPNDIAASVQSIASLPAGRSPKAEVHEVPCDHLTYFSTAESLKALVGVLDDEANASEVSQLEGSGKES